MRSVETLSGAQWHADRPGEVHFADHLQMDRDSTLMPTLGGVRSEEQTRQFLQAGLDHGERYG